MVYSLFSCSNRSSQLEGQWYNNKQVGYNAYTKIWTFKGEKFKYAGTDGRAEFKKSGHYQILDDSVYFYCNSQSLGLYRGRTLEQEEVAPSDTSKYKFTLKNDTMILIIPTDYTVFQRLK
jgi:hypothetical protein